MDVDETVDRGNIELKGVICDRQERHVARFGADKDSSWMLIQRLHSHQKYCRETAKIRSTGGPPFVFIRAIMVEESSDEGDRPPQGLFLCPPYLRSSGR